MSRGRESEWEYLPGQRINQQLITLRPTFLQSRKQTDHGTTKLKCSKYASDRTFLHYGGTKEAVRGLQDITAELVLTMEQEWTRGDEWVDWKGNRYSATKEWAYVMNPVPHDAAGWIRS